MEIKKANTEFHGEIIKKFNEYKEKNNVKDFRSYFTNHYLPGTIVVYEILKNLKIGSYAWIAETAMGYNTCTFYKINEKNIILIDTGIDDVFNNIYVADENLILKFKSVCDSLGYNDDDYLNHIRNTTKICEDCLFAD